MTTEYTPNFGLALPDFRMGPWHDLVNGNTSRLDALIFGAISSSETDLWANNTHYLPGITTLDGTDATIWMCVIDHVSPATGTFAQARTANPTYWTRLLTGFAPRGEWAHSTDYFPYDLAYQSSLGIFALCKTRHTSNTSGTIKDDAIYWSYLVDFSTIQSVIASAVSYSPTGQLTKTNVQLAIDEAEQQIIGLNTVNVQQGNNIGPVPQSGGVPVKSLQVQLDDLALAGSGRVSALEANTMKLVGNQTITGGFKVTAFNMGTGSGTTSPDPTKANYQYITNAGPFVWAAPTSDCAIDILVTNAAGAGIITFSGYTVGASIGDALTLVNGNRFIVSIRRINGISTYSIRALQ